MSDLRERAVRDNAGYNLSAFLEWLREQPKDKAAVIEATSIDLLIADLEVAVNVLAGPKPADDAPAKGRE